MFRQKFIYLHVEETSFHFHKLLCRNSFLSIHYWESAFMIDPSGHSTELIKVHLDEMDSGCNYVGHALNTLLSNTLLVHMKWGYDWPSFFMTLKMIEIKLQHQINNSNTCWWKYCAIKFCFEPRMWASEPSAAKNWGCLQDMDKTCS